MKNIKKIVIMVIISVVSFGSVSVSALSPDRQAEVDAAAARNNPTTNNPSNNTSNTNTPARPLLNPPLGNGTAGGSDLKTIFLNVLDVTQVIIIMVTTLYLILAGFMFVTAKGDPGKLKKARDALLWGLIGAALILCAEVLAYGIGDTVKEVFKGK